MPQGDPKSTANKEAKSGIDKIMGFALIIAAGWMATSLRDCVIRKKNEWTWSNETKAAVPLWGYKVYALDKSTSTKEMTVVNPKIGKDEINFFVPELDGGTTIKVAEKRTLHIRGKTRTGWIGTFKSQTRGTEFLWKEDEDWYQGYSWREDGEEGGEIKPDNEIVFRRLPR